MRVLLQRVGTDLVVAVADDGSGHAAVTQNNRTGYGLIGLAERIETLGGTLDHGPNPITGWTLTARIPIDSAAQVHS